MTLKRALISEKRRLCHVGAASLTNQMSTHHGGPGRRRRTPWVPCTRWPGVGSKRTPLRAGAGLAAGILAFLGPGDPSSQAGSCNFLWAPLRVFSHTFRVDFENYFRKLLDSAGMAEQTPTRSCVSMFLVKILLRGTVIKISSDSIGLSI